MRDLVHFGLDDLVDILKAVAEPTRLRLLALLADGDLTVSDLTEILGQSQPRISRHLKLLAEADLIDRYQEGAWAYFGLKRESGATAIARTILDTAAREDSTLQRDSERLLAVKRQRAERAQAYFSRHASEWDELRRLHASDDEIDAEIIRQIGPAHAGTLLDLGTGTGRMLELLQPLYGRALGIDASRDMLAVARANLDRAGIAKAAVRHGDILNLAYDGNEYDLVTIHQVLHFLDRPELAITEAARMLKPGGRLLIIDLAPHTLDHLREEHAHVRLGFSHATMAEWLKRAGLILDNAVDLHSGAASGEMLTVTLWLAHDARAPENSGQSGRPLQSPVRS